MSNFQYVTLVSAGGVPVRLADQNGAPFPTTGNGALVFANGPVLTNATLNGFVLNAPIGANSNGTQASPAFYILTTDKGLYSSGNGNVSVAASNFTLASFSVTGGGTFIDFFAANSTRLDITSDTASELIVAAFVAPATQTLLTLNKYGGDVNVGSASIGLGTGLSNLKVHGSVDVTKDAVLVSGGSLFSAVYFASRAVAIYTGSNAPTISGTFGSLYLRSDNAGLVLPYVNTNNATTWDQLVGATSTQTVSNKTFTGSTFSGTANFTSLQVNKGSITTDTPVLVTETWNNAGVVFHSLLVQVTATAFTSPSYLADFQVGGVDKWKVDSTGLVTQAAQLVVQAGGINVTGASTFVSGGVTITAGGLTVSAGGAAITGNVSNTGNYLTESGTAPPAGGAQDFGYLASNVAHLGVLFGTGAPTTTQAAGSIYVANSNNTPPYYNLTGAATWDQLVGLAATQTITNKTISGANNTFVAGTVPIASLVQGTNAQFLRGDDTWASPLGVAVQTFASSGTYTPHAKLLYAIIECFGGGGGGGGTASNAGSMSGGGGGGAGGYSRKTVSAATVGGSQVVTVGAAGSAAAAGNNGGGAGGQTSVGSLCVANGGGGGGGNNGAGVGLGGAGGVLAGAVGDVTTVGAQGFDAFFCNSTTSLGNPGCGGVTPLGGAGVGKVQSTGLAAQSNTGSGGGGGGQYNGSAATGGGAGSNGFVIITEFWVP